MCACRNRLSTTSWDDYKLLTTPDIAMLRWWIAYIKSLNPEFKVKTIHWWEICYQGQGMKMSHKLIKVKM